jgi:8-oxo-dGTP pyrophosphatase MutT (NUDIX family)
MMSLADKVRAVLARADELDALEGDDYQAAGEHVPASVLIAITDRPEPGVILTLRQASLRRHAGQIAFPGGRIDPEDESPVAAALREAWEEIGLEPADVAVVGTMPSYRTGSGYHIVPVIGVVDPDLPLTPHEAEVAAVFEVPLAFLLDTANHMLASRVFEGRERHFHVIEWEDRRIWGITAALIVNLSRRLRGLATA